MTDIATLKTALWYPWDDGRAGVTLVIGGILTLLSPLLIPGFVVLGYGLRVVEAVLDGEPRPPGFGDWTSMLVEGIKATVVLVVYVLLPLVVGAAILAAVANAAGFTLRGGLAGLTPALGGAAFVIVFLLAGLFLLVSYVAPAALIQLARSRRLGSAFAFDDVRELATDHSYGSAWLLALVVFAAAGVVLAVLNAAVLGVIVSGFVTFYAFVGMAYLYADGAEAAAVELAEPGPEPATEADEVAAEDEAS